MATSSLPISTGAAPASETTPADAPLGLDGSVPSSSVGAVINAPTTKGGRPRLLAALAGLFLLFLAALLGATSLFDGEDDDDIVCPAPRQVRTTRPTSSTLIGLPSTRLKEFHDAQGHEGRDVATAHASLQSCALWGSERSSSYPELNDPLSEDFDAGEPEPRRRLAPAPIGELRAHLECRTELLRHFGQELPDTHLVVFNQREEMVEHSHTMLKRCHEVSTDLQSLRRSELSSRPTGPAITALSMLGGLEKPMGDLFAGMEASEWLLEQMASANASGHSEDVDGVSNIGSKGIEEMIDEELMSTARAGLRGCVLRAVREARAVAAKLPATLPQVRRIAKCAPGMLTGLEALAVREAEKENNDPATRFALGMHQSEKALMVGRHGDALVPVFGQGPSAESAEAWRLDTDGAQVPVLVAVAEEILLGAEIASVGDSVVERAVFRAKRLCQHAQGVLAPLGLHLAAAARYHAAADVFAAHGQLKLAAKTLSDLAQTLHTRGDYEEALVASGKALVHDGSDAVALYLQAILRRRLGELRTDDDVREAENQLMQAAGRLPEQDLEVHRAVSHAELKGWGVVDAAGDFSICLELHDAARVLICLICRLTYG